MSRAFFLRISFWILISATIQLNLPLQAQNPHVDSLKNALTATNNINDSIKLHLYVDLANATLRIDPAESRLYCDSIYLILEDFKSKNQITPHIKLGYMNLYNALGMSYKITRQPDSAIINYKKSLQYARKFDDPLGEALAISNIAQLLQQGKQYDSALSMYISSKVIFDSLGEKKFSAFSLNSIGQIFYFNNDYEKALTYFKESADLKRELGDEYSLRISYSNIASIYYLLSEYDSSMNYYHRGIAIGKRLSHYSGLATMYGNLGELHLDGYGNLDSAIYYYQLQEELSKRVGNIRSEALASIAMGKINLSQGNYANTKVIIERTLHEIDSIGSTENKMEAYDLLEKASYALKDFRNAYLYSIKADSLKSLFLDKDKNKAISELETKYQTAQKEQKLLLQEEQINSQNITIEKEKAVRNYSILGSSLFFIALGFAFYSYKQSEKLRKLEEKFNAKMSHRVSGNLTQLLAFLKNNDRNNNGSTELVTRALTVIQRVEKFSNFREHQNEHIEISSFIGELIREVTDIHQKPDIKVDYKIPLVYMNGTDATSIGHIIDESIHNSMKYAFIGNNSKKQISVRLSNESDGSWMLQIQDNGSGFQRESQPLGSGLGLKLIDDSLKDVSFKHKLETVNGFELKVWIKSDRIYA